MTRRKSHLTLSPALLKAIAEKLIPGIPEETRIAILQQTKLNDGETPTSDAPQSKMNTRQEVIERATSRSLVEQEIQSKDSPVGNLRTLC